MQTLVKIGPRDHGRPWVYGENDRVDFKLGYEYEIIDGRIYVSPVANFNQNWLERWLIRKLDLYAEAHQEIVNYLSNKARVFVPRRKRETCPEPDLALYCGVPLHLPADKINWRDLSPFIVGEVLTNEENEEKDLKRNVRLYLLVPSIKEYWILDGRADSERPRLLVHRRRGARWSKSVIDFGETYTTKCLPGFELLIDPRR